MRRYDAYKDSGVEWIGEIPEGWEIRALKRSVTLLTDKSGDDTLPFVGLEQIESWTGKRLHAENQAVCAGNSLFAPMGTVLFGKLRPYLAKVYFIEADIACSTEFLPLYPNFYIGRYLQYALLADGFIGLADSSSYGTKMPRVNWEQIGTQLLPIPSSDEQEAIANYLDAKTSEIDELVADCEREIELLKEYRKAIISEAVTKGLDPDAPIKDSGIEWIGKIPEGWHVRPSKTLFAESKELRHPNDEQCAASQKYGIIPQAQYIALESQRMVAADKNLDSWKHVEPGDFVISLRSFQGGLELSAIAGCVTWHYIVLKGNRITEAAYYKYLFKTQKYIESLQRTCTYIRDGQDLRYSNFVQVPLPLPPKEEQIEIGAFLDAKMADIDSFIEARQTMVDKLREYRRSLISEAVTGKFKVPGA